MIFAQSLGEYAVTSGVIAQLARGVESGAQWIQLSWREDRFIWIAAGLCLVLGLWLTRRS
jgi:hypothetical protein